MGSESDEEYYILDVGHVDPKRLRAERDKARALKKSQWWRDRLSRGICHYCQKSFLPRELTMDHIVPLARGGKSTKGNLVPSCLSCNQKKKLGTPAEALLKGLKGDCKK